MIHKQILIQMTHFFYKTFNTSIRTWITQTHTHTHTKDRLLQKGQFGCFSANTDESPQALVHTRKKINNPKRSQHVLCNLWVLMQ